MGQSNYCDGSIYMGYWHQGIRHGNGKLVLANGQLFSGLFCSGYVVLNRDDNNQALVKEFVLASNTISVQYEFVGLVDDNGY